MSRQFKLRIPSGFTSPKQPSFRESAIQHPKPPTFLTLTQGPRTGYPPQSQRVSANSASGYPSRLDQSHLTERISNISNVKVTQIQNSQIKSINKERDSFQSHIPQFKYSEPSNIALERDKQEKQREQNAIIRQKQKQKEGKRLQGLSQLLRVAGKIRLKWKKSGLRIIQSYVRNLESLNLIALFKQHCATTIQKHFRRYVKEKNYRQFRVFVHRVKPLINAFQEGWRLRRVMKTKPIAKLVSAIQNKVAEEKQKEARILKRQMSSEIARLIKGSKWLSVKEEAKVQKQMVQSRSALLDKLRKEIPKQTDIVKRHTAIREEESQQSLPQSLIKNSWEDIPIKGVKESQDKAGNEFMSQEFERVQITKPKKIVKKIQAKPASRQSSKPKQTLTITIEQPQKIETKETNQKIKEPKNQSKTKREPSKQKSSGQLLLQKRTKYDPRKAAQENKLKTIIPVKSVESISRKESTSHLIKKEKEQTTDLKQIKEVPRNTIVNKRNILPQEANPRQDPTEPNPRSAKGHGEVVRHIGITEIQKVFDTVYSSKMESVNRKLRGAGRDRTNQKIPLMRVSSRLVSRFNPRHFHKLETQIIECYLD